MSLKLKRGMILLAIALCALIGIASAAGGGTGGAPEITMDFFEENPFATNPVATAFVPDEVINEGETDDEIANGDEIDDEVTNGEEVDDEVVDDEETVITKSADSFIEGQLLDAAERLSANRNAAEIEEVMVNVYDNVDGIVMVYLITSEGVVEAIYPDEYNAAINDFVGRSPVGGTLIKAREFTQTDEYTSAREKITGYDAIQPIISSNGEYLGAIVAKISS